MVGLLSMLTYYDVMKSALVEWLPERRHYVDGAFCYRVIIGRCYHERDIHIVCWFVERHWLIYHYAGGYAPWLILRDTVGASLHETLARERREDEMSERREKVTIVALFARRHHVILSLFFFFFCPVPAFYRSLIVSASIFRYPSFTAVSLFIGIEEDMMRAA